MEIFYGMFVVVTVLPTSNYGASVYAEKYSHGILRVMQSSLARKYYY